MADPQEFGTIPESQLRAYADNRVISSVRYVDEIERRRGLSHAREQIAVVPPLDYAVTDDELAIELAFDEFELAVVDDRLMPFDVAPLFSVTELAVLAAIGTTGFILLAIAIGVL